MSCRTCNDCSDCVDKEVRTKLDWIQVGEIIKENRCGLSEAINIYKTNKRGGQTADRMLLNII